MPSPFSLPTNDTLASYQERYPNLNFGERYNNNFSLGRRSSLGLNLCQCRAIARYCQHLH